MKIEKTSAQTPVVIDDVSDKTDVVESKPAPSSQQTKSNHPTAQIQLLNLAKNFGLDGGLRPADKQMPIEDRSERRERFNHLRRQQNMEKIVEKSLHYCSSSDVGDRADPDWFDSFVELAERVSNPTMQELWAKILAGEITRPGSYSLKALQAFKNLSLHDAKLFGKACSLAVKDVSKKNIRIISGCYQQPGLFNILDKQRELHVGLSQFGFSYGEVLTLADHHLLFAQETELYSLNKGEEVALKYNGQPLVLTARKNNCVVKFYKFTPIGAELAQLISDKPDEQFLQHLKAQLSYHFTCTS
ncbi:TIGR03899 family protein [Thalassotalea sp. M1531]|uniref:TIGR03899 family protein n=1 Tax=Thalassotalea algicola TaxID=2716224 RepID=A0A7Y0LC33_9GAMM|nr:TIGR03899 family protein [Thalassotalea algicola]NMP31706.1 TIGR03899 family protein [Thalassotalea algicola]